MTIFDHTRKLVAFRGRPTFFDYDISLARWQGRAMSIAVLSDLHIVAPWVSLREIRRIVEAVNAASPDLIVLAGDFLAGPTIPGRRANAKEIVHELSELYAPQGVFAILGNHDWEDCRLARETNNVRNSVAEAFAASPVALLRNSNSVLNHHGQAFALVGFDSQIPTPRDWSQGLHRPDKAYQHVPEDIPAILLAHEPDYFDSDDTRADLQISGHTHGGQMNLFGWRPMTPSQFGSKFAYGHHRSGDRHLIVSGGIGFSGLPMRIGQAPEITWITILPTETD